MTPSKILVIRNDRLGDFMLAFPVFILLRQMLPNAEIHALVPAYTREMAEACAGIDTAVIDPGANAGFAAQTDLWRRIKNNRYDAVITLFSTSRIGLVLLLAGIPYRLAPATKMWQLFYNKRLTQRRSRSEKPEYIYNLDLADRFLHDAGVQASTPTPPYLHFPDEHVTRLRREFCRRHTIESARPLVFVHAGSGGSANNLSLDQYGELIRRLRSRAGHTVVITAGPGEETAAEQLAGSLADISLVVFRSNQGLRRFAEHIQFADLFISGSTGPLHIAGALNRPTAAFYTRRRSATSLRWQTLNTPERRLAFSPAVDSPEEDMSTVDVAAAAVLISKTFLSA